MITNDEASDSLPLLTDENVQGSSRMHVHRVGSTPNRKQHVRRISNADEETLAQKSQGQTHVRRTMGQSGHRFILPTPLRCIVDALNRLLSAHGYPEPDDDRIVAAHDPGSVTTNSEQKTSRTTESKVAASDIVLMLLAFTHLVVWTTVIVLNLSPLVNNQWLTLLRLLRSPLLLVTWFYLFGINLSVCTAYNINYTSLVQLPHHTDLTPRYIFGTGGILTAAFTLFLSGFMFLVSAARGHNTQSGEVAVGLLSWVVLMLYVLNPLGILCRRERFTFVKSLGRSFLAPLFHVRFVDAWLADQLVSLVVVMLDFEYLICYYIGSGWTGSVTDYDAGICTTNQYYIRPIITVLPTTWRYLQCLRCYVDTKHTKHLWNALKYFTTYPVVFFATIYRPKTTNWLFSFEEFDFDLDDGIIFALWALSAFLNALYSFAWDVVFDWDLLSFKNKRVVHRKKRLYRPSCWYCLAVGLDFQLRFLWTVKISLAVLYHHNVDLVFTALTFAEVFRRFLWNFIRFENQWIRS